MKYCSTSAIRFSKASVVGAAGAASAAGAAAAGSGAGAGAAAAAGAGAAGAGAAASCAQDELVLNAMAVVATTAAESKLRQLLEWLILSILCYEVDWLRKESLSTPRAKSAQLFSDLGSHPVKWALNFSPKHGQKERKLFSGMVFSPGTRSRLTFFVRMPLAEACHGHACGKSGFAERF